MYLSDACFSASITDFRELRFADCNTDAPLQADQSVTITPLARLQQDRVN
jgi:hypothetical protein